jgi:hypothetical protein
MRKVLLLFALVVVLVACVDPMYAQPPPTPGCCYNEASNTYYPAGSIKIGGALDEHGCVAANLDVWTEGECPAVTPVPTVVPTPVPPPEEGGLWALIKAWADRFTIWKGDTASVAHILAVLATFLGVIQTLKKVLENAAKWQWVLKLIPQLAVVFNFLAHGIGPMILNALVTGGTLLTLAVQDGAVTAGEMLGIFGAVVGVDLFYRFIRKFLFPKTA